MTSVPSTLAALWDQIPPLPVRSTPRTLEIDGATQLISSSWVTALPKRSIHSTHRKCHLENGTLRGVVNDSNLFFRSGLSKIPGLVEQSGRDRRLNVSLASG